MSRKGIQVSIMNNITHPSTLVNGNSVSVLSGTVALLEVRMSTVSWLNMNISLIILKI